MSLPDGTERFPGPPSAWRTAWIAAAIAAVAAGLRGYQLGRLSFWYDEVVTMRLARAGGPAALIDQLFRIDATRAPLHPLLLEAWIGVFGTSEAGARALSVLCGVATVLLVLDIGRVAFDARVGLWSAWLAALSPALIVYSREARMYAWFVLATCVCWRLLLGLRTSFGWSRAAAYSLCLAALVYSHPLGLPMFATLALAGLLGLRETFGSLGRWLAVHLGAAVLFAPWVVHYLDHPPEFLSGPLPLRFLLGTPIAFIGGNFAALAGLVLVIIWGLMRYRRGEDTGGLRRGHLIPVRWLERFTMGRRSADGATSYRRSMEPSVGEASVPRPLPAQGLRHGTGEAMRSPRDGEAPAEPGPEARQEPRPPKERAALAGSCTGALAPAFFLLWLIVPPTALYLYSRLFQPIFGPQRYTVASAPAYLILVGLGLTRLPAALRYPVAIVLSLVAASELGPMVYDPELKADWRSFAAALAARSEGPALVIVVPPDEDRNVEVETARYYLPAGCEAIALAEATPERLYRARGAAVYLAVGARRGSPVVPPPGRIGPYTFRPDGSFPGLMILRAETARPSGIPQDSLEETRHEPIGAWVTLNRERGPSWQARRRAPFLGCRHLADLEPSGHLISFDGRRRSWQCR
jgi:hypothetical protein